MGLSCSLAIAHFDPVQRKKTCNQTWLVKMAGYKPYTSYASLWTLILSQSLKVQKERTRILTSHLVNNTYAM